MQSNTTPPLIRGVALDMDGLLFDTERLYFSVGDQVLQPRGHRFTAELQNRMMGRVGLAAVAEMISFHGLDDSPEVLLAESDRIYLQLLEKDLQPMPGMSEWIGQLVDSGLPFGLATSSRRVFVDRILPTIDWRHRLSFVLTGDDVENGKPHPEIYWKAAEKLGIDAGEMLVLEDSGNGTAAAVAAGAVVVAVPSEHTADHDFTGAHLVAESLRDEALQRILKATQR